MKMTEFLENPDFNFLIVSLEDFYIIFIKKSLIIPTVNSKGIENNF